QKLLQKAREQGSVHSEPDSAQTKVSEDRAKEKNGIITSEKNISEKLNNEKLNMEPKEIDHTRSRRRFAGEKVIKWTAVAAVTVFGIFGVSMTSEANRAYVMETVNNMTGNNTETEVDNNDVVISASTEEEAKENIATSLHIEMPQFYYWPYGMEYEDYIVDENAQTAIIQYRNGKSIFCFTIISNIQNASFFITSDSGEEIKNIKSQFMGEINSTLLKVMEEDDEQPTYILQWEYKNVYYELSGKILETEMEDIAENIIY
ncbi:MAG TPA: DUF4367 domain-containing protein, partial [Candidatus Blautia avicola]|nr:DUF4367 domain-containing protein [Candidatus Blautia avicola]